MQLEHLKNLIIKQQVKETVNEELSRIDLDSNSDADKNTNNGPDKQASGIRQGYQQKGTLDN